MPLFWSMSGQRKCSRSILKKTYIVQLLGISKISFKKENKGTSNYVKKHNVPSQRIIHRSVNGGKQPCMSCFASQRDKGAWTFVLCLIISAGITLLLKVAYILVSLFFCYWQVLLWAAYWQFVFSTCMRLRFSSLVCPETTLSVTTVLSVCEY